MDSLQPLNLSIDSNKNRENTNRNNNTHNKLRRHLSESAISIERSLQQLLFISKTQQQIKDDFKQQEFQRRQLSLERKFSLSDNIHIDGDVDIHLSSNNSNAQQKTSLSSLLTLSEENELDVNKAVHSAKQLLYLVDEYLSTDSQIPRSAGDGILEHCFKWVTVHGLQAIYAFQMEEEQTRSNNQRLDEKKQLFENETRLLCERFERLQAEFGIVSEQKSALKQELLISKQANVDYERAYEQEQELEQELQLAMQNCQKTTVELTEIQNQMRSRDKLIQKMEAEAIQLKYTLQQLRESKCILIASHVQKCQSLENDKQKLTEQSEMRRQKNMKSAALLNTNMEENQKLKNKLSEQSIVFNNALKNRKEQEQEQEQEEQEADAEKTVNYETRCASMQEQLDALHTQMADANCLLSQKDEQIQELQKTKNNSNNSSSDGGKLLIAEDGRDAHNNATESRTTETKAPTAESAAVPPSPSPSVSVSALNTKFVYRTLALVTLSCIGYYVYSRYNASRSYQRMLQAMRLWNARNQYKQYSQQVKQVTQIQKHNLVNKISNRQ